MDFDLVRPMFGGKLKQSQIDGINAIIAAFPASGDIRHLAYLLATAKHETAHTMQPIHERGAKAYFSKYEPRTKIGKALGNTEKGDGYRFRGRGYVQLTGRRNYALAGKKLGIDLIGDPEKALQPGAAARILIDGCEQGWFTGKKLSDYKTFTAMRRVVNGTDRAAEIAKLADGFLAALRAAPQATVTVKQPGEPSVTVPIPVNTLPPAPPKRSANRMWLVLLSLGAAIVAGILSLFPGTPGG